MPEFLISGCLRCLSPRDEDDRCLVLSTDRSLYQWALRYTTVETPEVTVQKCGSSCGQIEWGSAADCRLICSHHILPSKGANYEYAKLKLRYDGSHKKMCFSCVHLIISSFYEHIEEDDTSSVFLTSQSTLQENLESIRHQCRTSEKCQDVQKENTEFRTIESSNSISGAPRMEKSPAPYYCMHYANLLERSNAKNCHECISKENFGIVKKRVIQPTSPVSALLFNSEVLPVQRVAIGCTKMCDWVTGLSKPMCDFLRRIEKVDQDSGFTTSQPILPFSKAISSLADKSVENSVWFLQFENGNERFTVNEFKAVIFALRR